MFLRIKNEPVYMILLNYISKISVLYYQCTKCYSIGKETKRYLFVNMPVMCVICHDLFFSKEKYCRTTFIPVLETFCKGLVITNISRRDPLRFICGNNNTCVDNTLSLKCVAANGFISDNLQDKVVANKRWFTVILMMFIYVCH